MSGYVLLSGLRIENKCTSLLNSGQARKKIKEFGNGVKIGKRFLIEGRASE